MINKMQYEEYKRAIEEYEKNALNRIADLKKHYPEAFQIIEEINSLGYGLKISDICYDEGIECANDKNDVYFYFGKNTNYKIQFGALIQLRIDDVLSYEQMNDLIDGLRFKQFNIIHNEVNLKPIIEKYNIQIIDNIKEL